MKKKCNKCKQEKELTEFHKDKYQKDGKKNICALCLRKYIPEEIRCYCCREWFTKQKKNNKFCSLKCYKKHWAKIMAQKVSKTVYAAEYRRKHKEYEKKRHRDYYLANRERTLQMRRLRYIKKKHGKE